MDFKNLITELSAAAGIGHINEVKEVAKKHLEAFSKITDDENYLLAEFGDGEKAIMLEAHMDEIGMIVTEVTDDGFLSVASVGSVDARLLPSQPVKIYGKEVISGVFTSVPPHLGGSDTPTFDNIQIDTSRKYAKDIVSIGDFVLLDAAPAELLDNKLTSKALDNRSGMAAVIAAGEELSKANLPFKVILMFPVGEELGLRGARVAIYDKKVSKCIAVDVSFGNCPDVSPLKTAELGSGAMIGVSPILSRDIYKKLEEIAKDKKIPYTLEVMGGTTSTDADVISINQSGIPTGLVSIPLRNMHTPCEVVDINDVKAVATLIAEFVKGEAENE